MSELKIYVANFGWRGKEVYIAKSREDAYKMFVEDPPMGRLKSQLHIDEIQEFDIKEGHIYSDLGDS